jgi:hypothetical protein
MTECRTVVVACLFAALAVCPAFGQTVPPKPGPEVQRLGYFAGSWSIAGEFKTEPVGKYAGTMVCEWFEGGFVLICKGSYTGVRGTSSEMHIFSYSPTDKAYNWYSLGTTGAARTVQKMTVDGKKWICDSDGTFQGKPAKYHYEWLEESPASFTYGFTRFVEGGAAVPVVEVRVTKAR